MRGHSLLDYDPARRPLSCVGPIPHDGTADAQMFRAERGLRPRTVSWGEASEGSVKPPSERMAAQPSPANGGALMTHALRVVLSLVFVLGLVAMLPQAPAAQERVVKIAGVGAMTGVIRGFGINSKAVFDMTVDELNDKGGIKLADGTKAKIVTTFVDERCNAEEGISVVRKHRRAKVVFPEPEAPTRATRESAGTFRITTPPS